MVETCKNVTKIFQEDSHKKIKQTKKSSWKSNT